MSLKEQHFGLKFPIEVNSEDKTLFGLNQTMGEKIKSDIIHIIFTPKGQRLRDPNFGTRLVQFIFNKSDNQSWSDIVSEIKESVNLSIPKCNIEDVVLSEDNSGMSIICKIKYSYIELDGSTRKYEVITKL